MRARGRRRYRCREKETSRRSLRLVVRSRALEVESCLTTLDANFSRLDSRRGAGCHRKPAVSSGAANGDGLGDAREVRVKVTRPAFGTGSFSGQVQRDLGQDGFTRLVRYAYDQGIRFFETAESYDETHRMLGVALKGIPRDGIG
jgi:hypothetical protein